MTVRQAIDCLSEMPLDAILTPDKGLGFTSMPIPDRGTVGFQLRSASIDSLGRISLHVAHVGYPDKGDVLLYLEPSGMEAL